MRPLHPISSQSDIRMRGLRAVRGLRSVRGGRRPSRCGLEQSRRGDVACDRRGVARSRGSRLRRAAPRLCRPERGPDRSERAHDCADRRRSCARRVRGRRLAAAHARICARASHNEFRTAGALYELAGESPCAELTTQTWTDIDAVLAKGSWVTTIPELGSVEVEVVFPESRDVRARSSLLLGDGSMRTTIAHDLDGDILSTELTRSGERRPVFRLALDRPLSPARAPYAPADRGRLSNCVRTRLCVRCSMGAA